MRKFLCLLLIITCIGVAKGQSVYNVTGIVTDGKDIPIPGATVFITDSRMVTAANADGKFALRQVRAGKYTLVVKMMGYVASTHAFVLQNNDMRFRVKLQEDNIELRTANISAMSLAERKRHLATFIRCFLGISTNAKQCKILNTDILVFKFDKKKNILSANTDDFLVIENRALGYRLKYLLNSFVYDQSGLEAILSFDGSVFFEDMEGNARQKKMWQQQRVDAYLGSSMHFFRSLFSNKVERNGFTVYNMFNRLALEARIKEKKTIPIKYFTSIKLFRKYTNVADSNSRGFNLGLFKKDSTELYVVYRRNEEPREFLDGGTVIKNTFNMPEGQKSIITPLSDKVYINKNGSVSPIGHTQLAGFWMWGKMSWALPFDYEVPPGMEPSKIEDEGDTVDDETDSNGINNPDLKK
ncbi:carboxypeptidase-like regulatory domain-containing protein [Mucilaginibacter calamicampi]|uniref:Carboxypeptidase-like regulatory domain-containing protein n=1 Tax=Mucilaginibacter calamicampi TaxID=1302352 RepID=A0ABW2YR79_9SPHI